MNRSRDRGRTFTRWLIALGTSCLSAFGCQALLDLDPDARTGDAAADDGAARDAVPTDSPPDVTSEAGPDTGNVCPPQGAGGCAKWSTAREGNGRCYFRTPVPVVDQGPGNVFGSSNVIRHTSRSGDTRVMRSVTFIAVEWGAPPPLTWMPDVRSLKFVVSTTRVSPFQ
jgi:hypothetical protein